MINYRKSIRRLAMVCLAASALASAQAGQKPQYEVYAVRYATITDFPVSALLQGADPARKLDIAMTVWLIRGNGHNILVDSGFYREQFLKRWKPKDFRKPSEALAPLGLKPEEVTDVIITHMHWDHADGMDLSQRRVSGCRGTSTTTIRVKPGNTRTLTAVLTRMTCSLW